MREGLHLGDHRRFGPPAGGSGEFGPSAVTTTLVAQYPGAIDSMPAILDDVTPLSAQWYNHVQVMLEAIEAEVGPFPSGMQRFGFQVRTLLDMLGTSILPGLSTSRATTVAPAGRMYGVQQVHITQAANLYAAVQSGTVAQPFPHHPGGAGKWLFFAMAEVPQGQSPQVVIDGPATICGNVIGVSSVMAYSFRGMNGYSGGGHGVNFFEPFGSTPITCHALIFYPLTDEDT